jgi:hypothetical protein
LPSFSDAGDNQKQFAVYQRHTGQQCAEILLTDIAAAPLLANEAPATSKGRNQVLVALLIAICSSRFNSICKWPTHSQKFSGHNNLRHHFRRNKSAAAIVNLTWFHHRFIDRTCAQR